MKIRLQLRGIMEYLAVIFMILDFNTPYSNAQDINYPLTQITAILIAVLLLMNFSKYGMKRSTLNRWARYFIPFYLLAMFLLFNSVPSEHAFTFVAKMLIVYPALVFLFMLYAERDEMFRLLEKYVSIVTIIAGISLFFWIYGTQLGIIPPSNYIHAYWGEDYNYPIWFGVYTQRQTFYDNVSLFRNQGIFCEAPMFCFVLIVAVAYEIFLKTQVRNKSEVSQYSFIESNRNVIKREDHDSISSTAWDFHIAVKSSTFTMRKQQRARFITLRMILLIVATLSTMSTTGIILLIMAFVFRYFLTTPRDYLLKRMKPLLIVFFSIVGVYLAIQIFLKKSTSYSWRSRFDELRAGFLTFLSSPLWGTGFGTYNAMELFRSISHGKKAGTNNSIMEILSQGGIALGMVYLVPIFGTLWKAITRRQYGIVAFTVLITVAFSFTVVSYTFVMLTLLAFFNAYIIIEPIQGN